MRGLIIFAALATSISPALAQTAAAEQSPATQAVVAKRGSTIFDSSAKSLGTVLAVRDNGAVVINYRQAQVTIPAQSLSIVGGKLTTSLTRAEVGKLN